MADERWFVVTRYVRDDGRIIRHIYDNDGEHYTTRARALGACKRMIREDKERYGDSEIDRLTKKGRLEIVPVKVVEMPHD